VQFMSSIDFTHGYWQIPLANESQKYTGFKFNGRSYCFCVLPFGLSSSVSTFTRCLSQIFGHDYEQFLKIYIDDILILSETFEKHLEHLEL
ncbi:hypothetical protein PPYR_15405, partial [Photinus pyralis]